MQDLSRKFLTAQQQEQIEAAVQAAEKETSGEIVCMIQSASYHYPMADVIGAAALSLPLALAVTPLVGGWLWLGMHNMWLFLASFTLFFTAFYFAVKHTAWLKRLFISKHEIEEEVEEAASISFFRHGLYRTRDATGVLIFISVFERKVWLLADRGINGKVPPGQWNATVSRITDGIRQKRPAEAIIEGIQSVGRQLKAQFPVKPDDTDELRNLIISEE